MMNEEIKRFKTLEEALQSLNAEGWEDVMLLHIPMFHKYLPNPSERISYPINDYLAGGYIDEKGPNNSEYFAERIDINSVWLMPADVHHLFKHMEGIGENGIPGEVWDSAKIEKREYLVTRKEPESKENRIEVKGVVPEGAPNENDFLSTHVLSWGGLGDAIKAAKEAEDAGAHWVYIKALDTMELISFWENMVAVYGPVFIDDDRDPLNKEVVNDAIKDLYECC